MGTYRLPKNQQMVQGFPVGRLTALENRPSGGGTPGGSNTNVQINDSGAFYGDNGFNYNKMSNGGGVSVGLLTPLAELHVKPFQNQAALFTSLGSIGSVGYTFGSGDKNYSIYSKDSTIPLFGTAISTTFTEPSSTPYDPTNGAVSINYSETGYIANGYNFTYQIWALYGSQTAISVSSTTTNSVTDNGDTVSAYANDLTWTAPTGTTPDAYLVLNTGSNPNSGLYQVVLSTSFIDDSTGWTSSTSYTTLSYTVNLTYTPAAAPIDSNVIVNTTTTTYTTDGNGGALTDDNTWTSGSPTVTPTGQIKTAIFEGAQIDINNLPYVFPSSNVVGAFFNDGSGNLVWRSILDSDVSMGANGAIGVSDSSTGKLATNSNLLFDNTNNNLVFNANQTFIPTIENSFGTLNDYSITGKGAITFTNNPTVTGFAGGNNNGGNQIFINAINGVTLKNVNAGSANGNRFRLPGGQDLVVPTGAKILMAYSVSGSGSFWELVDASFQLKQTPGTWTAKQQFNTPIKTAGYTVAGLPTGSVGDIAYVTDALAPTFGATVVGGGAVKIPVFYDGTNWIVG